VGNNNKIAAMGRNKKIGLNYFPLDVDFFSDIKIRKLIKYQGGKSISIYALLLCNIYKNGYYLVWDKELPFIISEQTGFEEGYINEVIKCCFAIDLFSKEIYEKHDVLTSKGIQERYRIICGLCRRICDISEYNLISSEDIIINSEEKDINSEKGTQSKVNKRKGKEIKEKEIREEFDRFRKFYPGTKKGLDTEYENFVKKTKEYSKVVYELYPAIEKYISWRDKKKSLNQFVPEYAHLTTWINQKRWEVELEDIVVTEPISEKYRWTTIGGEREGSYDQYKNDLSRYGETHVKLISHAN